MDSLLNASPKFMVKRKKTRMVNDGSFLNGRKNKDIGNKENDDRIIKEHSQYIERRINVRGKGKLNLMRTVTAGQDNS